MVPIELKKVETNLSAEQRNHFLDIIALEEGVSVAELDAIDLALDEVSCKKEQELPIAQFWPEFHNAYVGKLSNAA